MVTREGRDQSELMEDILSAMEPKLAKHVDFRKKLEEKDMMLK